MNAIVFLGLLYSMGRYYGGAHYSRIAMGIIGLLEKKNNARIIGQFWCLESRACVRKIAVFSTDDSSCSYLDSCNNSTVTGNS